MFEILLNDNIKGRKQIPDGTYIYKVNDNDPDLETHITALLTSIKELYNTSTRTEAIKEVVYNNATRYKQEGQYHKAYYLFEWLFSIGYHDAGSQMEECKES